MANVIRYRFRSDTSDNWSNSNPKLLAGEPGFDTTNNKLKMGNGTNNWNDLSYISGDMDVNNLLDLASTWTFTMQDGSIVERKVISWISQT